MSYWALNACFLAVVVITASLAILRLRSRRVAGSGPVGLTLGTWSLAVGGGLVVLLLMTALFDNIMIGIGLVGYEPSLISGAFIGIAPLEDFAYAVAAAVLLPALWVLLERRTPVAPAPFQEDQA